MTKLLIGFALVAALAGGAALLLRGPVEQTTAAALRAFPVYSFVRIRNEALLVARHRGVDAGNLLIHRTRLSGPSDRSVTAPNNDTLYSFAFVRLDEPRLIVLPPLADRYHSVAVMDARADNVIVAGTRDGGRGETLILCAARSPSCESGAASTPGLRFVAVPTDEAWVLVRVLVDGPADLPAARTAQQGFEIGSVDYADPIDVPAPEIALLPAVPDPAILLGAANPIVARHPALEDSALAATGYGQGATAFEELPLWRQWLWRLIWPRIVERMRTGIAEGSSATDDGWSKSPPGIGTAKASDAVRAAVALGGLGALPVDEAVYWSASLDSGRAALDGAHRYRLRIPARVPAGAFWSLSLYERLPDGRLFYVANPIGRYAVSDRTPGLVRDRDGSLSLTLAATDPGDGVNWLPAPAGGPFTLIFRAYRPDPAIQDGRWRLPPVERLP